jgi:copper ion binding protein
MKLTVGGMTCPTCETSLERAIGGLPGVIFVHADFQASSVQVDFEASLDEADVRQAIEDAGYDLEEMESG